MPPVGGTLDDEQIASVLTYVRREWGHRRRTRSMSLP
jgi:mono/diheme cytochrome c family protein